MTSSKQIERGFGMVEIVMVVAAVLVLGAAGFVIYRHQHKDKVASTTPSTSHTSSKQTTSANTLSVQTTQTTNQVQIPELGVSVTVPDSIKDLQYTKVANVSSQNVASVDLTTKSLVADEPACTANGTDSTALGRLSKTNGQYPSDASQASGKLVKQFSTYYISYVAPQASCAVNNPSAESLLESQEAALQSSLTPSSVQAM